MELADGMAEIIRKSVRILRGNAGSSVVIHIQAVERDWEAYSQLPGG